ncbi:uncharacterized protein METZ01_LOCUS90226 [marine metagenome]|uniref:Peptidase M41 domain-containing protein n=1 Tax=marine metagenome TaxID=408172 RepID=A0A381VAI4_9ZZZZ
MTMIPTVALFLDWLGWRFSLLAGTAVAAGILLAKLMAFDRRFLNRRFWNVRRVAAYHEAGHAVVARSLGIDVKTLSIRPELGTGRPGGNPRGTLGRVRLCPSRGVKRALLDAWADGRVESPSREAVDRLGQRRPRTEQEDQVSAALQVHIAGEVVEQIKFGKRFEGNRGDLRNFHALVQGYYGNPRYSIAGSAIATLRREHWDECHRTLDQPEIWAWVEAVAQAALRRTVLTGDEIDGLRPADEALDARGADSTWDERSLDMR